MVCSLNRWKGRKKLLCTDWTGEREGKSWTNEREDKSNGLLTWLMKHKSNGLLTGLSNGLLTGLMKEKTKALVYSLNWLKKRQKQRFTHWTDKRKDKSIGLLTGLTEEKTKAMVYSLDWWKRRQNQWSIHWNKSNGLFTGTKAMVFSLDWWKRRQKQWSIHSLEQKQWSTLLTGTKKATVYSMDWQQGKTKAVVYSLNWWKKRWEWWRLWWRNRWGVCCRQNVLHDPIELRQDPESSAPLPMLALIWNGLGFKHFSWQVNNN